jgi:hypothetical protein
LPYIYKGTTRNIFTLGGGNISTDGDIPFNFHGKIRCREKLLLVFLMNAVHISSAAIKIGRSEEDVYRPSRIKINPFMHDTHCV